MTTPVEVVERIAELALLHPVYGCNRLEAQLALEGRRLSAITIQKILNDKGLGTRHERLASAGAQERRAGDRELSPGASSVPGKAQSLLQERHVESEPPGQLLSADILTVGTLKGIGRVYLHAVADTFGSYALGFLHVSKQAEAAVAVLHNNVLPFYAGLDLPISAVLTDIGREFCGTERHPTSSTRRSTTLRTGRPGSARPAPTASSSASRARCWRSFSGPPCAASSTRASRRCRPTLTPS
jgi:transposase InsO family protein